MTFVVEQVNTSVMARREIITSVMKAGEQIHARLVALLRAKLADPEANWSQQSIADATHGEVSQSAISTYLSGARKAKLDAAIAIARAVGEPRHFDAFAPAGQVHLEIDELPGLAAYERDSGPLGERERASVLGLARSEGPDSITIEVIERHVHTLRAIDRGKRQARPRDVEALVETGRGQKRVPKKTSKR